MSRGIVAGVSWYDYYDSKERVERVIAAPDDKIPEALAKLVASIPDGFREEVVTYFAPLLDRGEPKAGLYQGSYLAWWKRTHIIEDS